LSNEIKHMLSPGVRVRKEKFGLLFYNSKDTNLTFVKSGNILNIELAGGSILLTANPGIESEKTKLSRLIKHLTNKRLINEA
jgi:putative mycofactocin binding protein MftB